MSRFPFTVHPGETPTRVLLGNLRARWWVLALIWLGFSGVGLLSTHSAAALVVPTAFVVVVLAILGFALGCYRFYARATLTVTDTELIVKRVRRRVLPRAELGEAVFGFFGSDPLHSPSVGQAVGLLIADRHGRRFVRLPFALWPRDGLEQALDLLGLTPRLSGPEDEKRYTPWAIRHRFVTAFAGAIVLLAVIVGVIVVVDSVRGHALSRSATEAADGWSAYAARTLGSSDVPDLASSAARTFAEPDEHRVTMTIDLVIGDREHELPAAESAHAVELACAYHPAIDGGDLDTTVKVDRPRHSDAVTPRMLSVDCAVPDRAAVRSWLEYAEAHPLTDKEWSSLDFSALDGFGDGQETALDADLFVADLSRPTMQQALGWLCAAPRPTVDTVTLGVSGQVERTGRSADLYDADCRHPDLMWRRWVSSEDPS